MVPRQFHLLLGLWLLLLLLAKTTYAEPITPTLRITSGFATIDTGDFPDSFWVFNASGPGFSLNLFEDLGLGTTSISLVPPINASTGWGSDPDNTSGSVRVGSRQFDMSSGVRISLSFSSPPLTTAPPLPSDPNEFIEVSAPFTMTGTISGLISDGREFSYVIEGSGTTSFSGLLSDDRSFMTVESQFHSFEDAAPIPEPGTILLLSAAAGIAGLRQRKRLKVRH